MPTVINEFTIEPKATPPAEAPKQGAGGDEKPSASAKQEMARELRRQRVRAMRAWAH